MTAINFYVNGEKCTVDEWAETPLLWVLQIKLGYFEDTNYCEGDQCGLCSVSLDGQEIRACKTPLSRVAGRRITLD